MTEQNLGSPAGGAEVNIVPYSEELSESQREFATKMWPARRRRREQVYLRWKVRGPATGPVPDFLLAVAGGRVVGQLAFIPVTLCVDGRNVAAWWACNLMVDQSMRQRGIASRLFAVALRRGGVILGSGWNPQALRVETRLGFTIMRASPDMVLPIRAADVLSWKIPHKARRLLPVAATILQPLVDMNLRRLLRRRPDIDVQHCLWHELLPRIEHRQKLIAAPHILHDQSFLQWRCSGLAGFVRPVQALRCRRFGYVLFEFASRALRVCDWYAETVEEVHAMLHCLLGQALTGSVQTMRVCANSTEEEAWLRRAGFLAMRTPVQVIYYPSELLCETRAPFHYTLFDSDENL
jgi:GNAT superfamily N-acetyltransferase